MRGRGRWSNDEAVTAPTRPVQRTTPGPSGRRGGRVSIARPRPTRAWSSDEDEQPPTDRRRDPKTPGKTVMQGVRPGDDDVPAFAPMPSPPTMRAALSFGSAPPPRPSKPPARANSPPPRPSIHEEFADYHSSSDEDGECCFTGLEDDEDEPSPPAAAAAPAADMDLEMAADVHPCASLAQGLRAAGPAYVRTMQATTPAAGSGMDTNPDDFPELPYDSFDDEVTAAPAPAPARQRRPQTPEPTAEELYPDLVNRELYPELWSSDDDMGAPLEPARKAPAAERMDAAPAPALAPSRVQLPPARFQAPSYTGANAVPVRARAERMDAAPAPALAPARMPLPPARFHAPSYTSTSMSAPPVPAPAPASRYQGMFTTPAPAFAAVPERTYNQVDCGEDVQMDCGPAAVPVYVSDDIEMDSGPEPVHVPVDREVDMEDVYVEPPAVVQPYVRRPSPFDNVPWNRTTPFDNIPWLTPEVVAAPSQEVDMSGQMIQQQQPQQPQFQQCLPLPPRPFSNTFSDYVNMATAYGARTTAQVQEAGSAWQGAPNPAYAPAPVPVQTAGSAWPFQAQNPAPAPVAPAADFNSLQYSTGTRPMQPVAEPAPVPALASASALFSSLQYSTGTRPLPPVEAPAAPAPASVATAGYFAFLRQPVEASAAPVAEPAPAPVAPVVHVEPAADFDALQYSTGTRPTAPVPGPSEPESVPKPVITAPTTETVTELSTPAPGFASLFASVAPAFKAPAAQAPEQAPEQDIIPAVNVPSLGVTEEPASAPAKLPALAPAKTAAEGFARLFARVKPRMKAPEAQAQEKEQEQAQEQAQEQVSAPAADQSLSLSHPETETTIAAPSPAPAPGFASLFARVQPAFTAPAAQEECIAPAVNAPSLSASEQTKTASEATTAPPTPAPGFASLFARVQPAFTAPFAQAPEQAQEQEQEQCIAPAVNVPSLSLCPEETVTATEATAAPPTPAPGFASLFARIDPPPQAPVAPMFAPAAIVPSLSVFEQTKTATEEKAPAPAPAPGFASLFARVEPPAPIAPIFAPAANVPSLPAFITETRSEEPVPEAAKSPAPGPGYFASLFAPVPAATVLSLPAFSTETGTEESAIAPVSAFAPAQIDPPVAPVSAEAEAEDVTPRLAEASSNTEQNVDLPQPDLAVAPVSAAAHDEAESEYDARLAKAAANTELNVELAKPSPAKPAPRRTEPFVYKGVEHPNMFTRLTPEAQAHVDEARARLAAAPAPSNAKMQKEKLQAARQGRAKAALQRKLKAAQLNKEPIWKAGVGFIAKLKSKNFKQGPPRVKRQPVQPEPEPEPEPAEKRQVHWPEEDVAETHVVPRNDKLDLSFITTSDGDTTMTDGDGDAESEEASSEDSVSEASICEEPVPVPKAAAPKAAAPKVTGPRFFYPYQKIPGSQRRALARRRLQAEQEAKAREEALDDARLAEAAQNTLENMCRTMPERVVKKRTGAHRTGSGLFAFTRVGKHVLSRIGKVTSLLKPHRAPDANRVTKSKRERSPSPSTPASKRQRTDTDTDTTAPKPALMRPSPTLRRVAALFAAAASPSQAIAHVLSPQPVRKALRFSDAPPETHVVPTTRCTLPGRRTPFVALSSGTDYNLPVPHTQIRAERSETLRAAAAEVMAITGAKLVDMKFPLDARRLGPAAEVLNGAWRARERLDEVNQAMRDDYDYDYDGDGDGDGGGVFGAVVRLW
ncbi:hypothetical protein EDC01DRAFT_791682 [Geopyxis carbonaria]|nr:hypothetical protein EDC01DRAFT_791682 [Geopyxis carbonaria]